MKSISKIATYFLGVLVLIATICAPILYVQSIRKAGINTWSNLAEHWKEPLFLMMTIPILITLPIFIHLSWKFIKFIRKESRTQK